MAAWCSTNSELRNRSSFGFRLLNKAIFSATILSLLTHFPTVSGTSEISQNILPNSAGQLGEWNPVPQTCHRIEPDSFCGDMPYNYTTLVAGRLGPENFAGQADYADAVISLKSYTHLIQNGCSPFLKLFLCSVYLPMCHKVQPVDAVIVIPPCRPLCMAVHDKCISILDQFGYPWPPALNCSKFPETNVPNEMCMEGPVATKPPARGKSKSTTPKPPLFLTPQPIFPTHFSYTCQPENAMIRINSTNVCAFACDGNLLTSQDDKNAAEVFHGVVALFAVLLGFTVLAVYVCRAVQLTVQEKPVLMIVVCLIMVSVGYLVRLAGGRSGTGCTRDDDGPAYVIVNGVLEVKICIAVFVFLYYFAMAGNVWWIAMTVLWYLSAVKEVKAKDMGKYLKYAHAAAWSIPAVPTVVALWLKLVDADELSGICHVGQQTPQALLYFLLIPLCVIVATGSVILLYGFAVCRKRRLLTSLNDSRSTKASSSDCSTARLSIAPKTPSRKYILSDRLLFTKCALFLPSTVLVLILYIAEYVHKDFWTTAGSGVHGLPVLFYYLRVLMQYAYGYTMAMWLMITVATPRVHKKAPQKATQPLAPPLIITSPYNNLRDPRKMNIYDSELTSNDYASIPVPAPTEASFSFSTSTAFPFDGHLYNSKVAAQQQQQNFIRQEHSKRSLQSVLFPGNVKELPVTLV